MSEISEMKFETLLRLFNLDTSVLKIDFPFLIHSQIIIIALLQYSLQ